MRTKQHARNHSGRRNRHHSQPGKHRQGEVRPARALAAHPERIPGGAIAATSDGGCEIHLAGGEKWRGRIDEGAQHLFAAPPRICRSIRTSLVHLSTEAVCCASSSEEPVGISWTK